MSEKQGISNDKLLLSDLDLYVEEREMDGSCTGRGSPMIAAGRVVKRLHPEALTVIYRVRVWRKRRRQEKQMLLMRWIMC